MQTYKHFFPAYRRPGPTKDDLLLDTTSQHQDHVIVVCRDQVPILLLKCGLHRTPILINHALKCLRSRAGLPM
ncbi:hypothetical protein HPB48_002889 [Haemaphysalis longicornis]|uniref:Uncharacterized protein n=1 Tax=Haemaphysalis longicornis TaxID=44386 RepID=A0A9J6FDN0_HAELO|nr:hypothetical protein HPB48_002889 [Haemaphysalis longicornis]